MTSRRPNRPQGPSDDSAARSDSPRCATRTRLPGPHLWERLSIEFDDHTDELRILRLHLLHLLQTVSYNSEDLDIGVPARGLHGEAYRGHVFWDELFIFPVLNLRLPTDHPVRCCDTGTDGCWRRAVPPSSPATPARCSRGSPAATAARRARNCI